MSQTQSFDPRVPANVPTWIAASLTSALRDVGIRERGPANRGPQVDRFQPAWIVNDARKEGVPWCASAVCMWWFDGFQRHPLGGIIRGADKIKDEARKLGSWSDVGLACHPRPGDAFVLIHGVDTPGFDKGHTGLVLRVSADGRTVQCVEGNARNGVRLVQRTVPTVATPDQILGFASPLPKALMALWPVDDSWERGLLGGGFELPGGSTR